MAKTELEVRNEHGLHARPAALFVQTAGRFTSRITLRNVSRDGTPVDAKSIMSVLTAGIHSGTRIELDAEGADAEAAIEALAELVRNGMGEG